MKSQMQSTKTDIETCCKYAAFHEDQGDTRPGLMAISSHMFFILVKNELAKLKQ